MLILWSSCRPAGCLLSKWDLSLGQQVLQFYPTLVKSQKASHVFHSFCFESPPCVLVFIKWSLMVGKTWTEHIFCHIQKNVAVCFHCTYLHLSCACIHCRHPIPSTCDHLMIVLLVFLFFFFWAQVHRNFNSLDIQIKCPLIGPHYLT